MHRKLMVDIKRSRGALLKCKTKAQLDQESSKISVITRTHDNFICAVKELKEDDLLKICLLTLLNACKNALTCIMNAARVLAINLMIKLAKSSDTSEEETDPEPCDSVSQVDSRYSATSSKSSVVKRIELQKKRAELENMQELAKAKARKMRKLAEAEADEAEALAKVRLEMVNIEAEEQLLACSESGSSIVAPSKTSKAESVLRRRVGSENLAKPNTTNHVDSAIKIERFPEFNFDTRLSAKTPRFMLLKLDRTLTKPKLAINRINDSINRVNAWLNDETRQDAFVRIEPETVVPRIVQETKYPNCGVAKVPESAPETLTVKLVHLSNLKLAIGPNKRFQLIIKMLICSPILIVKAGTSTLHLLRKLLMTVTILLSFFTKTKFDGLWRRVPLRNVNSRCCEHLALDNHVRWLTCSVHL